MGRSKHLCMVYLVLVLNQPMKRGTMMLGTVYWIRLEDPYSCRLNVGLRSLGNYFFSPFSCYFFRTLSNTKYIQYLKINLFVSSKRLFILRIEIRRLLVTYTLMVLYVQEVVTLQKKYLIYWNQKMRFTQFIHYYNTLG